MTRGFFIVIEGTDAAGKKTQQDFLKENLENLGFQVETFDFPRYGERSCTMVEDYLNGRLGDINEISSKIASIFYAVDRFAVKKQMLQAISDGKIIISNRYVQSNQGYQGAKIKDDKERQELFDWLDDLEYNLFGIPRADLCILLDVTPEIGRKLVKTKSHRNYLGTKKKDMHEKDKALLDMSYKVYKQLSSEPGWITINCVEDGKLMSKEAISELVFREVKKYLKS